MLSYILCIINIIYQCLCMILIPFIERLYPGQTILKQKKVVHPCVKLASIVQNKIYDNTFVLDVTKHIVSKYHHHYKTIGEDIALLTQKKYDTSFIDLDVLKRYESYDKKYDKNVLQMHTDPCSGTLDISILLNTFSTLKHTDIDTNYILMISLYDEKNDTRFNELLYCLNINLANPFIKKIVVLYEKKSGRFEKYLIDKKIIVVKIDKRPSYNIFIDYANNLMKGKNVIISNSDIIFTESLNKIKENDIVDRIFALTRLNITSINNNVATYTDQYNYASQDAWIFKAPINKLHTDLMIGTMTCDSFLNAHFVCNEKKQVFNISRDVRIYHYQCDVEESASSKANRKTEIDLYYELHRSEILGSKRRILVCGLPLVSLAKLPEKTLFFYPSGEGHGQCPGCNECTWGSFFHGHMQMHDKILSCSVPLLLMFTKHSVFVGITNVENPTAILKITSSIDNENYYEVDCTISDSNILFTHYTEANSFKVYYKFTINVDKDKFLRYDNLHNKNIIMVGIAKNIGQCVDRTIKNLVRIRSYFNKSKIFIYENNSSDNTKELLKSHGSQYDNFTIVTEDINTDRDMYRIMAHARNKCVDFVRKQNIKTYPLVLVLDLDLVIDINIMSIMNCFNHNKQWDVQTANGIYDTDYHYWDTFAFRTLESDIPYYFEPDHNTGLNTYWKTYCNIPQKQCRVDKFIDVVSAFGGICLYRSECFLSGQYNENINDCEHVSFHKMLISKGKKIIINPNFIKFYSRIETANSFYDKTKFENNEFNKNKYYPLICSDMIKHIAWLNSTKSVTTCKTVNNILTKINISNIRIYTVEEDHIDPNKRKHKNKHIIARCLSHIKALTHLAELPGDYFLVCEDDLELIFTDTNAVRFSQSMDRIIAQVPNNMKDFDILLLHKTDHHQDQPNNVYVSWNSEYDAGNIITDIRSSNTYIITKQGVDKLIQKVNTLTAHNNLLLDVADVFIYKYLKTIVYQYNHF